MAGLPELLPALGVEIPQAQVPSWRDGLPVLRDPFVTLRELDPNDAPALLAVANKPSVLAHIAPPPSTVEGFERFIRWTNLQRARGAHVCFGIVPSGGDEPIGFVQIWPIIGDFSTAEWGLIFDDAYWGRGLFTRSATLALDFAFDQVGVCRLEARAAATNERANAAIRKLGATQEGILRRCFRCGNGEFTDHVMWSILAEDWEAFRLPDDDAA